MKELKSDELTSEVSQDKATVIYFGAEWCGPCRMIKPHLEEAEKVYGDKATFLQVNVDTSPKLSYEFGVRGVPTVAYLKKGQSTPSFIITGLKTRDEIIKQVKSIL